MNNFEWASATSTEEAVKLLKPEARPKDPDESPRPLAGGQDLLTTMKDFIVRPSRVVNLKTISNLDQIEGDEKSGLKIGTLVTLSQIEANAVIAKYVPGLAEAAHSVATTQIRNLATIGGNLCQRPRCWYFRLEHVICLKKGGSTCYAAEDEGENKFNAILGGGPSYIVHPSDLAPMLVALGATVTIQGEGATRDVPLEEFFVLPMDGPLRRENILKDYEIITHVHVPVSKLAARSTYEKFKERDSLDFATSAVAAAVELNDDKTVKDARIVLGAVAPIPWRVPKAEDALKGKTLDAATLAEVAKLALEDAEPLSKNAYKVPLTQALVRRALSRLGNA
jgi:xanthine dehydrogenase YagS FAD-binding subunit